MKQMKRTLIVGMALCVSLNATAAHAAWPFSDSSEKAPATQAEVLEAAIQQGMENLDVLGRRIYLYEKEIESRQADPSLRKDVSKFMADHSTAMVLSSLLASSLGGFIFRIASIEEVREQKKITIAIEGLEHYRAQLRTLRELHALQVSGSNDTALILQKLKSVVDYQNELIHMPAGFSPELGYFYRDTSASKYFEFLRHQSQVNLNNIDLANEAEAKKAIQNYTQETTKYLRANRKNVTIDMSNVARKAMAEFKTFRNMRTGAAIAFLAGAGLFVKTFFAESINEPDSQLYANYDSLVNAYMATQDRLAQNIQKQLELELVALRKK